MRLSKQMRAVLAGMLEDHNAGRKVSTGNPGGPDGLAVRLGSCEPAKYKTRTTWALQQRGLLTVGQACPPHFGAPIWQLTPAGIAQATQASP